MMQNHRQEPPVMQHSSTKPENKRGNKPELLAPAGSEESLHAAVENGADAVYFGIAGTGNFNARVRAKNISLDKLAETVTFLHRRNVRAYLTLNTLVFSDELPAVESLLREFTKARVDAVLVQDLGIARLAHELCPSLTLHASTQMSLTSSEAFSLAARAGIRRVVLPRELSIAQIRQLRSATDLELEAFVHGALCISYSGQCLTSLALGGRSANRGCCAQPCRMLYTLIDGAESIAGHLFSPTDLATLPLLHDLIAAGVCSLKIEGRLKPPEYVAEVTRIYREAIDVICDGNSSLSSPPDHKTNLERLALTFSRGFSTGWLEGVQPRKLVPGNVVAHRGTSLGTVIEVRRDAVVVRLSASVRRGDGVLFENKSSPEQSQGGRVYEIFFHKTSVREAASGNKVLLTFGNGTINADHVETGQEVRKTDDPQLERRIRKSLQSRRLSRRIPLHLRVRGVVGEPLSVEAVAPTGAKANISSESPLEDAKKHPLTFETLREQLGRLGETVFELRTVDADLDGKAMAPLSVLGKIRRKMIAALETEQVGDPAPLRWGKSLDELRRDDDLKQSQDVFKQTPLNRDFAATVRSAATVRIHVLFRDVRFFEDRLMLQRCLDAGCRSFYAELREPEVYEVAKKAIRDLDAQFVAVAPRIMKPGETWFLEHLCHLNPDAVLVRNLGALAFFQERDVPCIADFSLNIVNDLAFWQLLEWGHVLERITPGFDLDAERWATFLERIPAEKLEWVVQDRSPLFTMEHCLWKANLVSPERHCNKICRTRPLKIRDRYGAVHTVRSDCHCRNIVEDATPINVSQQLPDLIARGIRHLRIEWDDRLGFTHPDDAIRQTLDCRL